MKIIVEHHQSVLDIDFAAWRKAGVTCVLFDVDSTITPWLDGVVPPEIAERLRQARKAGVVHLGLATNSRNTERIADIARQVGADAFFTPARFAERKPRPSLIRRAMQQFSAAPEQVAMVGDKYSMDVRAAKRAGIARVAWVERLGDGDHPFDRYIRRPIEKLIKRKQRNYSRS